MLVLCIAYPSRKGSQLETRTLETSRSLARIPPRKGSARGGQGVAGSRLPLLAEQIGESGASFSETKSNKGQIYQ